MIDPYDITKFDRKIFELEEFWIFSICVANKEANRIADIVHKLVHCDVITPFDVIRMYLNEGVLMDKLKYFRVGQYNRIYKALKQTVETNFDVKNATIEDMEAIHGVGPKTARMFIMHSRPNQNVAALDTHILKFLRAKGYEAPKSTPSGKKYRELEEAFVSEAKKINMTPADLDLYIWETYKKGPVDDEYWNRNN
jgi:thermostable 8-oxoguanine DNA glycosylase